MQIIECPSCGGSNEIKNPGITMATCQYCRSTLFWDESAIIYAGAKATVPENDSPFRVGATGTINGHDFMVLGRIRLASGLSHWDQWFLSYNNDFAWLDERSRQLTLTTNMANGAELLGRQRPALGAAIDLGDTSYTIIEADRAQCMTVEGELPFTVPPKESLNYFLATSADGQRQALLCYNDRGQQRFTSGWLLDYNDVSLNDSESLESLYDQMLESQALSCAACGAALPAILPGMRTIGCPSCGATYDLGSTHPQLIGQGGDLSLAGKLDYTIDEQISIQDKKYDVCGRMVTVNDQGHSSCRYLLYSEDEGYLHLEKDGSRLILFSPCSQAPDGNANTWLHLRANETLTMGEITYQLENHDCREIKYVDGCFPWLATTGESDNYLTARNGSDFYQIRQNRTTIEFFKGEIFNIQNTTTATTTAKNQKKEDKGWIAGCGCGCLSVMVLFLGLIGIILAEDEEYSDLPQNNDGITESATVNQNNDEAGDLELYKDLFFGKNYQILKSQLAKNPATDWQNEVSQATTRWPKTAERLNAVKNDRDQKKYHLLAVFKTIDELGLEKETFNSEQVNSYRSLFKEYSQAIQNYNAANVELRGQLEQVTSTYEYILTGLKIQNGPGQAKYIASYNQVKVQPTGSQPVITVRQITEPKTKKEFTALLPYLGLAVRSKPQGNFDDQTKDVITVPGYYLIPAPGKKATSLGQWIDGNFVLADYASGLSDGLWSGCGQPPIAAFTDEINKDTEKLLALIGIGSDWSKKCYPAALDEQLQIIFAEEKAAEESGDDIRSHFHTIKIH